MCSLCSRPVVLSLVGSSIIARLCLGLGQVLCHSACHAYVWMLPVLFGAWELALVAVLGHVVDCAVYDVACDPYVSYIVITNQDSTSSRLLPGLCCYHGCFYGLDYVLLLWPGQCGASMVWTMCLLTSMRERERERRELVTSNEAKQEHRIIEWYSLHGRETTYSGL
jgi:hypothetical protein